MEEGRRTRWGQLGTRSDGRGQMRARWWGRTLGWNTRQEMEFQSGMGFQARDRVPDRGWDTRHRCR